MTRTPQASLDLEQIVDQLYDIALDPGSLETFIDAWNGAGLDARAARSTLENIDTFDQAYAAHLKRAETFLHRGEEDQPGLGELLAPFDNLAAAVVDNGLKVLACNAGASVSLGLREGDDLHLLQADPATLESFTDTLRDLFASARKPDRLLKLEIGPRNAQTLFQIRRLTEAGPDGQALALIVTTQYHWQPALGATLEEVFQITGAEQGVVRALVEGMDAKSIALERGTSEGTVRSQIKSILAKMNAHSQSEVIRLVLSFRDVAQGVAADGRIAANVAPLAPVDWLDAEVWKPFGTLTRPDGRRLDYLDMGPATGTPVLYSHMGFCAVRWSRLMLKHAFRHNLRIICPVRAGYGQSSNLDRRADVMQTTRDDTLALLDHLGIARLPYLTQGNDLIFAVDLAGKRPDVVSEIIGICARPYLPGDLHYATMGKWHRFFLSTAKHAPHLLTFTAKAVVAMARRVGLIEMFRQVMKDSPADVAMIDDPDIYPIMVSCGELIAGKSANISQSYAMELLQTEADWSDLMIAAKATPTWFVNGLEDPSTDMATIAEYRDHYPWIEIEVVPNAGQFTLYQRYADLIPRFAHAAKMAASGIAAGTGTD